MKERKRDQRHNDRIFKIICNVKWSKTLISNIIKKMAEKIAGPLRSHPQGILYTVGRGDQRWGDNWQLLLKAFISTGTLIIIHSKSWPWLPVTRDVKP